LISPGAECNFLFLFYQAGVKFDIIPDTIFVLPLTAKPWGLSENSI
jgi:hypothetical protein